MAGNTIITLSPIQKFSVVFDLWFLKAEFYVAVFHIKLSGIVSKPYHSTFFSYSYTHTCTYLYYIYLLLLTMCLLGKTYPFVGVV